MLKRWSWRKTCVKDATKAVAGEDLASWQVEVVVKRASLCRVKGSRSPLRVLSWPWHRAARSSKKLQSRRRSPLRARGPVFKFSASEALLCIPLIRFIALSNLLVASELDLGALIIAVFPHFGCVFATFSHA